MQSKDICKGLGSDANRELKPSLKKPCKVVVEDIYKNSRSDSKIDLGDGKAKRILKYNSNRCELNQSFLPR